MASIHDRALSAHHLTEIALPVSDAGLGAFSYFIDAIAAAIGGVRRSRFVPWLAALFGLLVIPPGVASIVICTWKRRIF